MKKKLSSISMVLLFMGALSYTVVHGAVAPEECLHCGSVEACLFGDGPQGYNACSLHLDEVTGEIVGCSVGGGYCPGWNP